MLGGNVKTAAIIGDTNMHSIERDCLPFTAPALLFIRVRWQHFLRLMPGKHERAITFACSTQAFAFAPVAPFRVFDSNRLSSFDLSQRGDCERVRVRDGIQLVPECSINERGSRT